MRSNKPARCILTLLLLMLTLVVGAQRRVTPVEPNTSASSVSADKQQRVDPSRIAHTHDADGNVVLIDTVTGLEYRDTLTSRIPRMIYPLIYRATAGVNIWDMAMRCLGQKYGLGGFWVELNMHNRYFPYFEAGLGAADISPDGANYRFKSSVAPYFKIGAAYNMFYNSDPSYQFLAGLRYGFTPFSFSVNDVTVDDSYWGETSTFNIPSQRSTAGYLEVTFGVKVKIVGPLSMGWNLIYHQMLHESKCRMGRPMYIPGYGKRGTSFTASLSVMYTIDLNKAPTKVVDKVDNDQ